MGFLCGIFYYSLALCHDRREHYVYRRSHGYNVHIDMGSAQSVYRCFHYAAFYGYLCPQSLKSLNMLVYRTASYVTSAGQRHLCVTVFTQKGTKKIIRSPYLPDIVRIDIYILYLGSVYFDGMTIKSPDLYAYAFHRLHHDIRIPYIGDVFNSHGLIGHNRCGNDGKCSVLGSADNDFAGQGSAAVYYIMILICF